MAELKTKETKASVTKFLNAIPDETRRNDCFAVAEIMQAVTKEEPKMWGPSIVGFGRYRYKYESGREGEWMLAGFSPRKGDLTLYIMRWLRRVSRTDETSGQTQDGKVVFVYQEIG